MFRHATRAPPDGGVARGNAAPAALASGVEAFWTILAWASLAAWVVLPSWWWWGMRRIPRLGPADAVMRGALGSAGAVPEAVAVVVAARDEARTPASAAALAAAARSWLALDLPVLELVVVDDRSSDATAEVLRAALADDPRARVLGVDRLPGGWLGKVHALDVGVRATRAPWVVFTDADVRMHPRAVAVALCAAERWGADHVALLPRFVAGGWLLRAFVVGFALLLTVLVRPWEAPDPRSPRTLGVGAFGLYRRRALERAGGLAAVRARPDDDLALAQAVKAAGGRSGVAFAPDLLEVDWYPSLPAALRGLEKNAFSGVGYRLGLLLLAVIGLLATHVAPFALALLGPSAARAPAWAVVAIVLGVYAVHGRWARHAPWYGLAHPVTVVLLVVALVRAAALALATGHVRWRGRRYPLAWLRERARADARRDAAAARAFRGRRDRACG
jgi:hypothetical protein